MFPSLKTFVEIFMQNNKYQNSQKKSIIMENILYKYIGLLITGQDIPIPQFEPFFTKDAEMVPKLI